ncbi:hypothetical protein [Sporosarcina sp. HYO08]|uniref:hypothetical protein n=1 Tax=Sporosarcina sp. HYO08 TaxID=1759557 RepID=UPI000797D0DA|nr:hypothetical protein [Sporosarcina sp. HYO08]KXH80719.1 hypothetical protein AU377_08205 [Sporosarcina sp. HYO08]
MGPFEFIGMMGIVVIILLLFMWIGEKCIVQFTRRNVSPFMKIVSSMLFTLIIVGIGTMIVDQAPSFYAFLIAMGIIVFNKYWLGHFSEEESEQVEKSINDESSLMHF